MLYTVTADDENKASCGCAPGGHFCGEAKRLWDQVNEAARKHIQCLERNRRKGRVCQESWDQYHLAMQAYEEHVARAEEEIS